MIVENPFGTANNIFQLIVNTAIVIQKVLKIYCNDCPTKDGTPVGAYIYEMDLAEAHIKIMDYLIKRKSLYMNLN